MGGEDLSQEDLEQIRELEKRDAEVRAHEMAHKGAAGSHGGSISYTYQTGPDGKKYAIGGEVPVDISPVSGDPQATIAKMQTIRRAALAPADPSSADRRIAAKASQMVVKAQAELMVEEKEAPKTLQGKEERQERQSDETGKGGAYGPSETQGAHVPKASPDAGTQAATHERGVTNPALQPDSPAPRADSSAQQVPVNSTETFEASVDNNSSAQAKSYGPPTAGFGAARRGYSQAGITVPRLNTYG